MATPTSTERSAELAQQSDPAPSPTVASPTLELPIAPDFVSLPPRIDPNRVLDLSASFLPQHQKKPGFWGRRAQDRCPVEFDLNHPRRAPATYPKALIDELFGKYLNP